MSKTSVIQQEVVRQGTCGKSLTWTLYDTGELVIEGTGEMTDWSSFSAVGWYSDRNNITQVTIASGVTTIGKNAFFGCSAMTDLTIPNTITKIGNQAFYNAAALTDVTIPDSVTSLGEYAFSGCTGMTGITIEGGVTKIETGVFYGCSSLTDVSLADSITNIGDLAFRGCTALTVIMIPDSVTTIGDRAFYDCGSLTTVTLSANLSSISHSLFCGCSALSSVAIPRSVTYIEAYAFSGCNSLTDVYFSGSSIQWRYISVESPNDPLEDVTVHCEPSSIEGTCGKKLTWSLYDTGELVIEGTGAMTDWSGSTGTSWYAYRAGIQTVTVTSGVTSVGKYAFYGCSALTAISLPDTVTRIGECAFFNCTSLISANIPDTVTRLEGFAFRGCSALTSVTLPSHITALEEYVLYQCESLTSLTIPDSVTRIGEYALFGCSGLTAITIPDNVTVIEGDAFSECVGITAFTVPDGVTEIGHKVFAECTELVTVTIPGSVTAIGFELFYNCNKLRHIYFGGSKLQWKTISYSEVPSRATLHTAASSFGGTCGKNMTWTLFDNGDFRIEGSGAMWDWRETAQTPWYACAPYIQAVTIGEQVTRIGCHAFDNAHGDYSLLTSVSMADTVTEIGDSAFYQCSNLTSLPLSATLSVIGDSAFYGCTGLTEVTMPDSLTAIEDAAFKNCTGLVTVSIAGSLTAIEDSVFENDSALTALSLPGSVASVGDWAFYRCNQLSSVTYGGTPDQWDSLTVGAGNDCLENKTVHCLGENPPPVQYPLGDVNNDTVVDVKDSLALTRYLAHWKDYSMIDPEAADVDQDGKVTPIDSAILRRRAAGWADYQTLPYILIPAGTTGSGAAAQISLPSLIASKGDTVEMYVTLCDNPGIMSMRLSVTYDQNALTLLSVSDCGVLSGQMHGYDFDQMPYLLYWENATVTENISVNGKLAKLTFEVKNDADAGRYPVTVECVSENADLINAQLGIVNAEVLSGSIHVLPGSATLPVIVASDVRENEPQTCHVRLLSPEPISGIVLAGIYDGDRMISVHIYEAQENFTVVADTSAGNRLTLLWWDSVESMTPIAACAQNY